MKRCDACGCLPERERRHGLRTVLFFLLLVYVVSYVWPGRWRYDRLGATPIRTERVTGRVQFCNFHGWQWTYPLPEDTKK